MSAVVVEVSHIPTSASFYAAITQPFGIRILKEYDGSRTLHFGFSASSSTRRNIITLVQRSSPVPTTITFAATSPEHVQAFHSLAVKAANHFDIADSLDLSSPNSVAQVYDFDGNMIEARHTSPPPPHNLFRTADPTPAKQAHRIEAWLSQSDSTTPSDHLAYEKTVSATPIGGFIPGISNTELVGTVLGAAAGAAAAWAMVSGSGSDRNKRPVVYVSNENVDPSKMYPAGSRHRSNGSNGSRSYNDRIDDIESRIRSITVRDSPQYDTVIVDEWKNGARSHVVSSHPGSKHGKSRPSSVLSSSSRHQHHEPLRILPPPSHRSTSSRRGLERHDSGIDTRSQPSVVASRASSHRSRHSDRESSVTIKNAPSRAPSKAASHHSDRDRKDRHRSSEASSYVSARSSHSRATPRPPLSSASRRDISPSHSRHRSRRNSDVAAHMVALPKSVVGGGSVVSRRSSSVKPGGWDIPLPPSSVFDGDDVSVAPSDSISSVGSKRERLRMMGSASYMERGQTRGEGRESRRDREWESGGRRVRSDVQRLRERFS